LAARFHKDSSRNPRNDFLVPANMGDQWVTLRFLNYLQDAAGARNLVFDLAVTQRHGEVESVNG